MVVTLGLALSIGLVWWEKKNNLSLLHLGPIAIALFFLVLAFVLFQALKKAGGLWAGIFLTAAALRTQVKFSRQIWYSIRKEAQ